MKQGIKPNGEHCNHEDHYFNGQCYECNECSYVWGCIGEDDIDE